jgi:hypothetical protein
VTAEVGSEGGSYADATVQVASSGTALWREEGGGGPGSVAADATRSDEISGGGAGTHPGPATGMRRYPTEAPGILEGSPRGAEQSATWRAGLIGAAAGFAGAAIVGALSRRRRDR